MNAWALGAQDETGILVPGKRADVVILSGDPFSVHSLAEQVFIDGAHVRPKRSFYATDVGLRNRDSPEQAKAYRVGRFR
jgi:adenine deaminase